MQKLAVSEVERLRLLQQDINAQCPKSTRHCFNLKHVAFSSSQCRSQMQLIGSKKYSNSIQIPSPQKRLKTDLAKQNAGNMIVNSWMTTVVSVSQVGGRGRDAGCGA